MVDTSILKFNANKIFLCFKLAVPTPKPFVYFTLLLYAIKFNCLLMDIEIEIANKETVTKLYKWSLYL